jgi:hypothetical protein
LAIAVREYSTVRMLATLPFTRTRPFASMSRFPLSISRSSFPVSFNFHLLCVALMALQPWHPSRISGKKDDPNPTHIHLNMDFLTGQMSACHLLAPGPLGCQVDAGEIPTSFGA